MKTTDRGPYLEMILKTSSDCCSGKPVNLFSDMRKKFGSDLGSLVLLCVMSAIGSLFNDDFSVTRLYSVDDRMTSEW
jgi:hypothetical protein